MRNDIGITPNVPGTSPVTDVPQPGNDPYANEPGAHDIQPRGAAGEQQQPDTTTTHPANPENNPFSGSPTGGVGDVDPSGPTVGTEDWGRRSSESNVIGRTGGDEARRSDEMANPQNVTRDNEQDVRFQCSQLHSECKWETSGRSVEELLPRIEQHGREKHGLQSFGQEFKEKILRLLHKRAA